VKNNIYIEKADFTINHREVGFAPNPSLNRMAVVITNAKKPITTAICSNDVF
jgi:hypothetical protein